MGQKPKFWVSNIRYWYRVFNTNRPFKSWYYAHLWHYKVTLPKLPFIYSSKSVIKLDNIYRNKTKTGLLESRQRVGPLLRRLFVKVSQRMILFETSNSMHRQFTLLTIGVALVTTLASITADFAVGFVFHVVIRSWKMPFTQPVPKTFSQWPPSRHWCSGNVLS